MPTPDRVVLVPGLGLGPEAWQPTLAALESPLRGEVVLLPGYGAPAGHGRDLRPKTLASELVGRVRLDGPALLVGHSASCQVVAHAALLAPGLVRGLLLVGPTTDPRARSWPRLVRRWLATAVHERPGQVPSLVRQYHRTKLRSMTRGMDAARRDPIQTALGQVSCPVVVLRGRHDRICPLDWAVSLGPTVTLSHGGHMVPLTHGEQVAAELVDFAVSLRG